MAMKCQLCNRHDAVIKYSFYVDCQLEELAVCPICASKINSFSGKLTSDEIKLFFQVNEATNSKCKVCKTNEKDIFMGYFGCDNCYKDYHEVVERYIKENCNGESYKGKIPLEVDDARKVQKVERPQPKKVEKIEIPKEPTVEKIIDKLTKEKNAAVANEDYALAKELKIKIDKLKEGK